ncbi:MAG: HWE histidine kinase domain-containing protein [Acetobacteraceae bacterium]|nr:HWE histidine kinase domain-containing protein [Acetobacteraceae bacterium]
MSRHGAQGPRVEESIRASIERFNERRSSGDPFVVGVTDAILAMSISDPSLPDNPIIYVNAAFETLTGYPMDEVVGRNCRFLQGPETDQADVERLRGAIADQSRISLDLLNYRRDGSRFWNRLLVTPVFAADGDLQYFFASQFDVTVERDRVVALEAEQRGLISENERVRREMLDTQARLDLALQAGQLGTWNLDPLSLQLDASLGCKLVFGAAADDPFTYRDFLDIVHLDDRSRVGAAVEATLSTGIPYDIDYRIVTKSGDRRWIAARGALLTRRDGSALSMAGFVTDITGRKDAEEHRALLADELTHRVKNTLATVGAVVNQSLRNATSLAEARDTISSRIASLATAHDLLIRNEIEGAGIGDIVRSTLSTFDDGTGTLFTIEGPEVRLEPSVTLALSMALHELATNAVKYGALSVAGGSVEIRWGLQGNEAGHRDFDFLWREVGGPPVSPPTRSGFGSRMIDRLMARHMRGSAATQFLPEGVQFSLRTVL